MTKKIPFFLVGLTLLLLTHFVLAAGPFEITIVDDHATGYATFQSHNQKVVQNQHGIFLSYIRTRNEPYTAQNWRLMRLVDAGASFQMILEATDATNPPVLETDAKGRSVVLFFKIKVR
jgi:hypothetical protein